MAGGNKVTKLELRLVDGLSGPAKAAMRSISKLNKSLASVRGASGGGGVGAAGPSGHGSARGSSRGGTRSALDVGGHIVDAAKGVRRTAGDTAALSAAAAFGVTSAAKQAYDMERQLNISQAAGNLNLKQRNELQQHAVALNAKYAATSAEIVGGVNELLKAGFSYEQAMGAIEGVLDSAQAMELPIADASKAITDSMVSLDLPMRSMEESLGSSLKMADLFARAVQATNASLEDFAVSSKYFNPVAKAFKMSAEEAMAWQMVLAKAGIRGSSAGTGLRAAPISIVAPSKKGREAYARLGLDPSQFTGNKKSDATGASISGALEAAGFNPEGMEAAIDRLIADRRFKAAPAKLARAIIDQFSDDLGVSTAEDQSLLSDTIQRALQAGVKDVDMYKMLKALKDKGASPADFKDIFGGNHASKMMAVNIGLFEDMLKLAKESSGTAKTMREAMMAGIVGDVSEMTAAAEKLSIAFGRSGLLADAAKGIDAMASSISRLADSNPALLRLAGYATIAVAALAPLGFALTGIATIAGIVASPIGLAATALGAIAAVNITPISNGLRTFSNALRRTIDPAIIVRLRAGGEQVKEFFGSFRLQNLGLNRLADEAGIAAGRFLNSAVEMGKGLAAFASSQWDAGVPKLKTWGDAMRQFAADNAAANLPTISAGLDSIRQALEGFVMTKVDAIVQLGTSLGQFATRILPMFGPAASSAITLAAESFRTLAAGVNALGSISNAALDGVVAFATGFVNNIDPAAMQSIANGLKTAFEAMATPARLAGDAFEWISKSINGANTSIKDFAGLAGSAMAQGMSAIINVLAAPAETVIAIFERIKGAVEAAKAAIASMGNIGGAFGGLPSGGGAQPTTPGGRAGAAIGGMIAPLPRRAAGGLVRQDRTYLVGERGPETFTPGKTGSITPNHKMGGGETHQHFNIKSSNPQGVVNEIMRRMHRQVSRSIDSSMDGRWDY